MTNDGGPAFPRQHAVVDANDPCFKRGRGANGMTIRDYFAAAAMQSIASKYFESEDIASRAYRISDAMLRERMKDEIN